MVMYKIDRRGGGVQKSYTRTDPDKEHYIYYCEIIRYVLDVLKVTKAY